MSFARINIASLKNASRNFRRNKLGSVGITAAVAAIPLFMLVATAMDYSRMNTAKVQAKAALDAAAIAAAAAYSTGGEDSGYQQLAQKQFDTNKPDNLVGNPQVSATPTNNGASMTVTADLAIKVSMLPILGIHELKLVDSHAGMDEDGVKGFGSTVNLPAFTQEHKGEIVFVMDYSGSMNQYLGGERKYVTMREEAKRLINSLSQSKVNQYVKFGVVPFSAQVYTTMKKKYWHGFKGEQMRSSCTGDREYPYNLSDATPLEPNNKKHVTRFGKVKKTQHWYHGRWRWFPNNNPNSWKFYQGSYNYRNNCSQYSGWRHLEIQDLTSNHQDTFNKVSNMRPYGSTHIAVGMEFGYHLLSPNPPFTAGVSYSDDETEKAVILLTDGAQTSRAFGPGGSYNVQNGESNLAQLCTNMKASGIRVLTVSYDLYNQQTENRLRNCASSEEDYYDADTKHELVAAFSEITAKLSRDMYIAR